MMTTINLRRFHFMLCCTLLVSCAQAQPGSLAPPHAPLVEGAPVPVTAHPDQLLLLDSTDPGLAANKRLVFDFWRQVILGGDVDTIDDFLAPEYREHNPLLPNGSTRFKAYLGSHAERKNVPPTIDDLVTLVAEGPYVVMALVSHYPEAEGDGTYTSTHFEMFRLNNGKIAEHWDSTLFRAGQTVPDYGDDTALPVTGVRGSRQLALITSHNPDLRMNKRLVFDLWRQIPEAGREELAPLYMDERYIQHNPNAATGRAGAVNYFRQRPDTGIDTWLEAPLVAMVAEGDIVVQVLETEREQNGVEYKVPWFDMFRIADGLAIEHWDSASRGELPAIMQQGLAR